MPTYTIYTDGSCLRNPGGRGGWAAIIKDESTGASEEICGGRASTTNNRMEISAVLESLRHLPDASEVTVVTDSQYVQNSITKRWVYNWAKKGWRTDTGGVRLNADLWKALLEEMKRHRKVTIKWIRGHKGHPENERCDVLARQTAERPDLPEDTGYVHGFLV